MGDSYGDPQKGRNFERTRDGARTGFRGARNNNPREAGGFRIRLSDNEMRASRSLQEAFNLRSTVAVLGFALRTLGQMLDEGKLDDLITEYRSQSNRPNKTKFEKEGKRNMNDHQTKSKPNPFARPEKPDKQSNEANKTNEEDNNTDSLSDEESNSANSTKQTDTQEIVDKSDEAISESKNE